MRHLYLKIYFAVLAIIAAVAVLGPLFWWLFGPEFEDRRMYDTIATLVSRSLPAAAAAKEEQQRGLLQLASELDVQLTLYDSNQTLIAASDAPQPPPEPSSPSGWQFSPEAGPVIVLNLSDGRLLTAVHHRPSHSPLMLLLPLSALLVFSLGIYLLVRRLTRRLERLQRGVEQLGAGDLATRVPVEGCDEIGRLAIDFNRAAERIEALVQSQKRLLATASHELRTPLTRLRVAADLHAEAPSTALREELARDIDELDRLIDELLLAARLDGGAPLPPPEECDLLALLAEESVHYEAECSGESALLRGQPHLLRRLLRNLLENSRRYGNGTRIEAEVCRSGGEALVTISDRGPGIAEVERERIFDPFYRPAGLAEDGIGGVGLGLALVRQIAALHGGSVACQPRAGGGACFTVRLPLAQAAITETPAIADAAPASIRR